MKINKEKEVLLTQKKFKKILSYDLNSGTFANLFNRGGTARAGQIAGGIDKSTGYVTIMINGYHYQAHRLAWLYVHGKFPSGDKPFIDHINGDKSDNRISNLRESSYSGNNKNRAAYNKTGVKGVRRTPNGKYAATISVPATKRQEHLGTYTTVEEASLVYEEKSREYSGEFYCTNTSTSKIRDIAEEQ